MLLNLKHYGFDQDELLQVYKTMMRPVADYAAAVYHKQDKIIDRCQNHGLGLKCILGVRILLARKMRQIMGLPTLRQRKIEICDKFKKTIPQCEALSPLKRGRTNKRATQSGQVEVYQEKRTQCE